MAEHGRLVLEQGAGGTLWAYRPADRRARGGAGRGGARARPRARAAARRAWSRARASCRRPRRRTPCARPSRSRLSIVTGGPGTGKTATIRMICAAAAAQDATVLLVAPTGRAARRMSESTGLDASTVHAALGWVPDQGPTVDELHADVLIVDETSMANLELLVTLLRAVGPRTHVVLVGDADQLAPVGAGKPFAELVEAGRGARDRAHPHLPPGRREHDRARRARRAPGDAPSFRGRGRPHARPLPRRAGRPGAGAGGGRLARLRAPAGALRRRPGGGHPGLRARLPRRARHRRAQRAAAGACSTPTAGRCSAGGCGRATS